jgi:hypothetical protein
MVSFFSTGLFFLFSFSLQGKFTSFPLATYWNYQDMPNTYLPSKAYLPTFNELPSYQSTLQDIPSYLKWTT